MIGNTLVHRELTSSYTAKFAIEKDRMYIENANRASREGYITVDNLEPNPKNPIIQTTLSEDVKRLLKMIECNPDMTNSLLAEKLGWSVSRVKYYVQNI